MLERVAPLEPRAAWTVAAVGCVLAETVTSPEDVPPFANTAMDGYAVRAADVAGARRRTSPVELPVVAEVAAGHPAERALAAGEAMRIFTGAPIPDGADAVVMVERTPPPRRRRARGHRGGGAGGGGRPGRPATTSAPATSCSSPARCIGAGHLGVLAGIGVGEVRVHPRLRVGVLSTGDELVEAGRAARARARSATPTGPRSWPWSRSRGGRRSTSG